MKKHILLLFAVSSILLSSCTSTYFYSTLNTKNSDIEKVENGDFLFENDSIWIAYCFKGEDAPIQITVYNKLDVPVYVDWQRSALILNGTAYTYGGGKSTFVGTTKSHSYGSYWWDEYYTSGVTEGSVEAPKHISFLPPKTKASHSSLRLSARFDEIKDKEYVEGHLATKDKVTQKIKRINYDNQNTPVQFSSYITVCIGGDSKNVQSYESTFYVTHLIKTKVRPRDLPNNMADRGDTFYQHVRPDNTGWHILAGTAIVAGAVAIDVMVHDDYNYDHHHHY